MQNYKDGAFTEERLNEAVRRVLEAQAIVGAEHPHAEPFTEQDRENYFNIAKDCITAVTDPGVDAALPKDNTDRVFIILDKHEDPAGDPRLVSLGLDRGEGSRGIPRGRGSSFA